MGHPLLISLQEISYSHFPLTGNKKDCDTLVLYFLSFSYFSLLYSQYVVIFTKGHLPLKVIFHQRLSYIKGYLPSSELSVCHQRFSSIKGCLPSNPIFHQRLSSIKWVVSWLYVIIYQRPRVDNSTGTPKVFPRNTQEQNPSKRCWEYGSVPIQAIFAYSIKGLPSKMVFRQRLSPIKSCLPSKVVSHQRLSSIKNKIKDITSVMVDLINVKDKLELSCAKLR